MKDTNKSQRREGSFLNGRPAKVSPGSTGRIWTCGHVDETDCEQRAFSASAGGRESRNAMVDSRLSVSGEESRARGRVGSDNGELCVLGG